MGKNNLSKMMEKLSQDANLSVVYTNHCVRVTTITYLNLGGVTANRIFSVTQHQDEKSVGHYLEEPSAEEKRSRFAILSKALASTGSSCSNATINRNQMIVSEVDEMNTLS